MGMVCPKDDHNDIDEKTCNNCHFRRDKPGAGPGLRFDAQLFKKADRKRACGQYTDPCSYRNNGAFFSYCGHGNAPCFMGIQKYRLAYRHLEPEKDH